ncbi:HAD-like domain-containing protein [Phascolomyces articulosus]|uniref:HAD-like domain-containing protein n=1 Tax=Phascolomyces articulosus TaxID=60185 RepID=A0AAD5K5L4_9FUNG|nr:HAD-like domain-containing protein [Phascolomyces articulosus]
MTTRTWWEKMIYETFITAGVKKQDLDPVYEKLFDILWIRFATAEGYTIFPEVHNTLTQLKQHGYQMGVISNSDDTLESILKDLELVQYFDFIVPSCFVGHEKPDSRIYERALELAGNIHPNETLHIGDDIEKYMSIFF